MKLTDERIRRAHRTTRNPSQVIANHLKIFFPWLGTDREVDACDVVDAMQDYYRTARNLSQEVTR